MTDTGTALEQAGATISAVGLKIDDPEGLTWDKYEELGRFLGALSKSLPFWIGDFLLYGERVFGEEYAQIEANLSLRPQTLANYRSVAFHIPPSRRKPGLSFGVHAEVAYLPPRERDEMLSLAARSDWKREHVREYMQRKRAIEAETGQEVPAAQILELPPAPRPKCPHCGGELA